MRIESLDEDRVFLIHDFLSPSECEREIARSEGVGYEEAPITTAAGPVMHKDIRDNSRLIDDNPLLANLLYERAREHLPPRIKTRRLTGFNERFRFYRYDPGEKFAPHYDGSYVRNNRERSELTFLIYLNDDLLGGETNFYFRSHDPVLSVAPIRGSALVFVHWKLHEGAPVLRGRKYVLRTDVMYAEEPAT